MNSSPCATRKIASNYLWQRQGLLPNPVVELDARGMVLGVEQCVEVDRCAGVEFYAGILLPATSDRLDLDPSEVLRLLRVGDHSALEGLLGLPAPGRCVLWLLSGIDYRTISATPHTALHRIL